MHPGGVGGGQVWTTVCSDKTDGEQPGCRSEKQTVGKVGAVFSTLFSKAFICTSPHRIISQV